ncbi:Kinesin-like protein kif15 [Nowakowskiella sp. JEL0407]|nr:Kinesin-like protein kif15 [Nowakowskiella sp. JEL0407]
MLTATEGSSIKTFIRVRPNSHPATHSLLSLSDSQVAIDGYSFSFDGVLNQHSSQLDVFTLLGREICLHALRGYNATIFAYGQTGSGKTFTMQGPTSFLQGINPLSGIIQRTLDFLFSYTPDPTDDINLTSPPQIKILHYVEIYNEVIYDLLQDGETVCALRDLGSQVLLLGAKEVAVDSLDSALRVLEDGRRNRTTFATDMNRESSRSHSVLTLQITTKTTSGTTISRLSLVDLAGSERQKSTSTTGDRLREGNHINKSLLSLSHCIRALVDISNGKQRHVHYRDSKLTFLLKDSLGGNAKVSLVATVAEDSASLASTGAGVGGETMSTLRFAGMARLVKTRAMLNIKQDEDVEELRRQVLRLKQELMELKANPENFKHRGVSPTDPTHVDPNSSEFTELTHRDRVDGTDITVSPDEETLILVIKQIHARLKDSETTVSSLTSKLDSLEKIIQYQTKQIQSEKMMKRFKELQLEKYELMKSTSGIEIAQNSHPYQQIVKLEESLNFVLKELSNPQKDPTTLKFAVQVVDLQSKLKQYESLSTDLQNLSILKSTLQKIEDGVVERLVKWKDEEEKRFEEFKGEVEGEWKRRCEERERECEVVQRECEELKEKMKELNEIQNSRRQSILITDTQRDTLSDSAKENIPTSTTTSSSTNTNGTKTGAKQNEEKRFELVTLAGAEPQFATEDDVVSEESLQIQRLMIEIENYQIMLNKSENENLELRARIAVLEEESKIGINTAFKTARDMRSDVERMVHEVEDVLEEKQKLSLDVLELNSQLIESKEIIKEFEKSMEASAVLVHELEQSKLQNEQKITLLTTQLSSLTSLKPTLSSTSTQTDDPHPPSQTTKKPHESDTETITNLQTQLESLQSYHTSLLSTTSLLESTISTLQSENTQLQQHASTLQSSFSNLQEKYTMLGQKLHEVEIKKRIGEEELEILRYERDKSEEELKRRGEDEERWGKRVKVLEGEKGELERFLEEKDKLISKLRQENEQFLRNNNPHAKIQYLAELKKENNDLRNERATLLSRFEALETVLKTTNTVANRVGASEQGDGVIPSVYDFAGQDVYSSLQQLFVTTNAVYVVVFDIKKMFPVKNKRAGVWRWIGRNKKIDSSDISIDELQVVLSWLSTIVLRAPDAKILLVGTQADGSDFDGDALSLKIAEKLKRLEDLIPKPVIEQLVLDGDGLVFVCSAKTGKGISKLKRAIEKTVKLSVAEAEEKPLGWIRFHDELASRVNVKDCKMVYSVEEMMQLWIEGHDLFGISSEEDLKENIFLEDYVFPDPQTLINVICSLFRWSFDPPTIADVDPKNRKIGIDERVHDLIFSLMKEFDLFCEIKKFEPRCGVFSKGDVIIPCLLPESHIDSNILAEYGIRTNYIPVDLVFSLKDNTLPKGLYHQLAIRFASNSRRGSNPRVHLYSAIVSLGENDLMIMKEELIYGVVTIRLFISNSEDLQLEFIRSWMIIESTISAVLEAHWSMRSKAVAWNLLVQCNGVYTAKQHPIPHGLTVITEFNSKFPKSPVFCDHPSHDGCKLDLSPLRPYWYASTDDKSEIRSFGMRTLNLDLKNTVMLSYSWGEKDPITKKYPDQEKVKSLKVSLEKRNFDVWMDVFYMNGNMISKMKNVIEECAVMIACVSSSYHKENSNAYDEFLYACARKRDRVVGVKLTPDADMLGGAYGFKKGYHHLFYDISGDDKDFYEKSLDDLSDHLRALII